jgi:alginate O-acetyltransferase complex protein AlgJ
VARPGAVDLRDGPRGGVHRRPEQELPPRRRAAGRRAARAIEQQNDILDDVDDPLYLDLRSPLRALDEAGEQSFWKSDTHFSPAGSATYATALADRVEPGFSDGLETDTTPVTRVGDLARLAGLSYTETLPGARVETGATARFAPRPTAYDTPEDFAAVHTWRSRPASRTVPGRTVIIGDSFTYYSLPTLSPLFARGEFYWISVDPPEEIARAVEAADTVVIQVVERYVGPYGGGNRDAIRAAIDAALTTDPPG